MNTDRVTAHLSANDITQWLVEGPTAQAKAHVESCSNCKGKLADAREPLTAFRAAVVEWSEKQPAAPIDIREEKKGFRGWTLLDWMPTASVAFALLVLAIFTVERGSWLKHPGAENAGKPSAVSDSILMEQADEEVSEAVPDAMAPLTDLVAWDSNSAAASEAVAAKHVFKKKPAAVHPRSRAQEKN